MLIKKLCHISLVILILSLVLCIPVSASDNPIFYSAGVTYQAESELYNIHGRIASVIAESDKQGMAGIEQDIRIKTADGYAVVEIINWYYGLEEGLALGLTVYAESGFIFESKIPAQIGEVYSYELTIVESVVEVKIRDSQDNLIFKSSYNCGAQYIESTASYIEYWRYEGEGSFFYYGYVTIDNPQFLSCHRDGDYYYKARGYPFDLYLIHHIWDGNYVDKGEIDDR